MTTNYYSAQQQQTPYQQNISYYQQQQAMMRPAQSPLLKGRLVSSLEEAKAASIDFDGSIFYFPDLANRRIYTKQINMDGTATLLMYELKEMPVDAPTPETHSFITREEFDAAIQQLRTDLQAVPAKTQITF